MPCAASPRSDCSPRVSHPSLVTLFDAHLSADSRSYLVMEYIDGGTLADRS